MQDRELESLQASEDGMTVSMAEKDAYVAKADNAALLPYPWCIGAPTTTDCINAGYCKRNPSCGD